MLRLEVAGVGDLRAKLRELSVSLEDMQSLWDDYAEIMSETEAAWFETEGDGVWPPLAESTVAYKASHGWPPETMIRRGFLAESLIDPAQAMDVSQGRSTLGTFTRKAMTWGTDVRDDRGREFAHYHQHTDPVTGEPVDYGNRPPLRQVIPWPLPLQTQARMARAREDWVEDLIRKSGLKE